MVDSHPHGLGLDFNLLVENGSSDKILSKVIQSIDANPKQRGGQTQIETTKLNIFLVPVLRDTSSSLSPIRGRPIQICIAQDREPPTS